MLLKNCNTFDFTRNQRFKTLTRANLGGCPFTAINQVGSPVHLHTLHIPKATTDAITNIGKRNNQACRVNIFVFIAPVIAQLLQEGLSKLLLVLRT